MKTVGELKLEIEGLADDTPIILIDTSGKGLSPVYSLGEFDVIDMQRERRHDHTLTDPEDYAVFALNRSGDSGDFMASADEEEIVWPGEDGW